MDIEILNASGNKPITTLHDLSPNITILEIKKQIQGVKKSLYPDRQALRVGPKTKTLKDEELLKNLGLQSGDKLYVKDLGPQIGWKTVFLAEYAGPLGVYLWIYSRPWFFYGSKAAQMPMHSVVHIAAVCYTIHYVKRLLETVFVHRFSHNTMPLSNLFKNCSYYWLFTGYVAYHINHPLYTAPGCKYQIYGALIAFVLSEIGNFSIHIALRNLRPPGTKIRKIPIPTSNPFTQLFKLVSCPNYTYEVSSWLSFAVMTQCLPAGLFALAGFYQMAVWALGKHRAYKKEFSNYPKCRRAIVPFLL